jgi:hypothetical protein
VTSEITQGLENGGIPDVTPTVRIEGIPFLDQVIRGRYDGVKVTARGVSTGGLTASRVDIEATGVRWPLDELADGNTAAIRADRVTAELVVPVSELTTALGPRGVTFAVEGDRLRITAPFEFAGIRGTVSGLADAVVIGGSLRVQFSDLSAVGQTLPQSIADALARQLSTVLDVPRLPYGLRLESVRVTSEGLVAAASGRDVALVR